jgi:hypothetical protein
VVCSREKIEALKKQHLKYVLGTACISWLSIQ